jgi:hypothetical protein
MLATPRFAQHSREHSIPKRDTLRDKSRGSVQPIVSVMLTHDGYDPIR